MRPFLVVALLLAAMSIASAQTVAPAANAAAISTEDSDHDGLSDVLEDTLLTQFAPRFMVNADDCSGRPAAFVPFNANPAVQEQDGTIYGQAFPRPGNAGQVELHYYHLWQSDCGERSHNRDAEHVSVLVGRGDSSDSSEWKALYWYAAAHEDTVCDASQIARAATLNAEEHGPPIWVSRGKHASFLSGTICRGGCGGDDCTSDEPLNTAKIVNLGELSAPMNGATWVGSPVWPLATKMVRSDFPDVRTARMSGTADAGVAWANPGKKPMVAIILGSNNALGGAATGMQATSAALDNADLHATNALNGASDSTTGSLEKGYRSVKKALGISARKVGKALDSK